MFDIKWILLGVMPVALMGCGTKSLLVNDSDAVTLSHVEAAGRKLMVMKPSKNAQLRFVSNKQRGFNGAPSINDASIALNVAAAFTLDIETMDVCGDHVVAGERKKGYDDVTATGHMLILDNNVTIRGNESLKESIKAAVEGKGYLFQQCYIVEDGRGVLERVPKPILDRNPHILWRAACVMDNGEFAVVQSGAEMCCSEFINGLVALGVQQALYLDMGTWGWGWVREKGKPTQELDEHYFNTRFQSNWLQIIIP